MELTEFKSFIREEEPEYIASHFYKSQTIHAYDDSKYTDFCSTVTDMFQSVTDVRIMGSGNWKFSLNPDNNFREFHAGSDIDTVVVSPFEYEKAWLELRKFHQMKWYSLNKEQRDRLNRNGQNVYAGFASPLWIPDKKNALRFDFIRRKGRLAGTFGREINMLFFKNHDEVLDYYKRGIIIAKRRLQKNGI